jgi:membrane protein required for colicin V production
LTFVLAVFAWGLLSALAKKLIEAVGLRPVDRTLGAFFGLLRAAVLILVLGVVVVSTPLQSQIWWTQSVSAPWLTDAVASILPALSVEWGRLLPSA